MNQHWNKWLLTGIYAHREYILLDTFSWTNGGAASLSTMCDTDTDASSAKNVKSIENI